MKDTEMNLPNLYPALKKFDLMFAQEEVSEFIYLWNEGISIGDICKRFKKLYNHSRNENEIIILMLDLWLESKIKPRKGGIEGIV